MLAQQESGALAAALAGGMNSVEGSSQQRGRIIGAAPTEVGGSAPQTPGSSTSATTAPVALS